MPKRRVLLAHSVSQEVVALRGRAEAGVKEGRDVSSVCFRLFFPSLLLPRL